jgi:hypothetical protein
MPARTYTVKLGDGDLKVTSEELSRYRDLYLGPCELASRISELLWLDIFVFERQGVTAGLLLLAIKDLEKWDQSFWHEACQTIQKEAA